MDLMTRRRALLATVESEPDEYLEFDGTFYFKTGYLPTADTQVIVKFSCDNNISSNMPIFGSRAGVFTNSFYAWARVDYAKQMRIERSASLPAASWTNVSYQLESQNIYILDTGAATLYENDAVVSTWTYNGTAFEGSNMPLFIGQINNNGSLIPGLKFTGKIYNFKILENGVVVRNYVPYNGELNDQITGQILEKYYS